MKFQIDTRFAIDVLSRQPYVTDVLPGIVGPGAGLSIFTFTELWEGVYTSRDPIGAARGLREFLRGVQLLTFSRRVALRAARLRDELRVLRRPVGQRAIDILIAATALEHDLELVSSNQGYDDIPNLKRRDPRTWR